MEFDWLWLYRNRIIKWKSSFKCILCTFEFGKDYVNEIKIHIEDNPFHIKGIKKIDCELKDSLGNEVIPSVCEEIVKNCIFFNTNDNQLRCYLCRYTFPCYSDVLEHVKTRKHLQKINNNKNALSSLKSKTYVFTNDLYCKTCKVFCLTPMSTLKHIMDHFPKMLPHSTSFDIIKVFNSHIVCSLCNINISSDKLEDHLKSTQHVKRNNFLKSRKPILQENQISTNEWKLIKQIFFNFFNIRTWRCSKCETDIPNEFHLIPHFMGRIHQLNAMKNVKWSDHLIKENIISYHCYLCNESFGTDIFSLFFHYYTSIEHKIKLELFDQISKQNHLNMIEIKGTIFVECSLCQIKMNDMESINAHFNETKHKSCVIANKQLPISEMKSCKTQCNEKTKNKETKVSKVKNEKSKTSELASSKKESEYHCTEMARNKTKEKFDYYPIADEQFQLDVLDIIEDLDGLRLNKVKMNRFIPVHKRESQSKSCNVQANRVSIFDQNILKNGTQYIDLCIKQAKTNIYNTSSIKLTNINLSINFIIKVNDDHFCLLCNKQFSSEVNVIMEHFFSKDHIKNLQNQNNSLTKTEDSSNISNDNLTFALPYISHTTNESFHCHACKNDIAEYNVFEHALSQNHMLKCENMKKNAFNILLKIMTLLKNTWYYAQYFNCQVCNMKYQMEIEFVEHLKNENHCKKVKMCIEKGEVLEFHTCYACVTCIYGDSRKYYGHCDDIFHKRYLSKGDYNVSKMMPPLIDLLSRIEDKKQKLLFESDSITLESSQENSLLKAVEKVVEHLYPNAKAYKFGSRCSYTALSNSDLDIFLDCDNMYHENFDTSLSHKYLSSVIDCFKNLEDEWYIEETLFDTRVPIIKLRHYPTDLKCDISFSNGLACRKSKLVRYYNDAYKMCRELILYLKKWVIFSQLSGTEGISTFTVSWLVIFYLQVKGVLPSVYELIKCQTRSIIIDGWECGYQKNFCITSNDSSFVENLVGLFTFYAEFDYQKYVICPYLGSIIEKEKFATKELPAELTAILNDKNRKAVSLFRFDSPMCMQDPTDLSQNSTKALRKRQLRCFKEYCSSSVDRIISGQQATDL
ncbi:uncharacterized protein LOC111693904 [Trichogramma pretiosum]|uniref:uncharacterized protein LOC111693904 n=1 Tax=Trichogramma pretiosum TaxID=7493 RepID=UPI000C71B1CB|nr:uncharacterized protein LOC111693904 [Trichogramma pretiosum]